MKRSIVILSLTLSVLVTNLTHADDHDEMSALETPHSTAFSFFSMKSILPFADYTSAPLKQVLGFYSKGTISGASEIDLEGVGFVKLHRPRKRQYTSYDMTQIVPQVAAEMSKAFPKGERLQIGDCSGESGGYISGHASHQNGLDGDFGYFQVDHLEQDPEDTTGFPESFVKNSKITANFDTERNWFALKEFVKTNRILRIFVDEAIKKHLCAYAKSLGEETTEEETLRRLRPYPNHDDHFHLRITCPINSPDCVPQEEVPPGSGC